MRTVLLRHELPDGSWHYDWMLERDAEAGLVTFRVGERVDEAGCVAFAAERIGDHRRAYLTYEGPVSGDRGGVKRVGAGRVGWVTAAGDEWRLELAWEGAEPALWTGLREDGERWRFLRK